MAGDVDCMLICLPFPDGSAILDVLREKFPNTKVTFLSPTNCDMNAIPWAEHADTAILCTYLDKLPPVGVLPKLVNVHYFSAGVDTAKQHPLFTDTDVAFTCSTGIHGPQIAEWVFLTAMFYTHNFAHLWSDCQRKHWPADFFASPTVMRTRDMYRQRLAVLGYGSIGRQVARVGEAMGMSVIAHTASPRPTPESRRDDGYVLPGVGDPHGTIPCAWFSGTDKESLHDFLRQDVDLLVVCVPLTSETHHLLSTEEFDILSKKQALLSNISRGGIIDQPALARALEDGKLRGALLDVADPEPLPADNPLWDAPNCIITPHTSGGTADYLPRAVDLLVANLERRRDGLPMFNVVDRRKGY